MSAITDKPLPRDTEAEQGLLAACLESEAAFDEVSRYITPEMFFWPEHQRIYALTCAMRDEGTPLNLDTFCAAAEKEGVLDAIGGREFLIDLVSSYISDAFVPVYAKTIAEKYRLRQMIRLGTELVRTAYDPTASAGELVERCERVLSSMTAIEGETGDVSDIVKALPQPLAEGETGIKLPWGGKAFQAIGSLRPGRLYIICGRPGWGKTAFCTDIFRLATFRFRVPSAMFVFDHTEKEMVDRICAAQISVPFVRVAGRDWRPEDHSKLQEFIATWKQVPARIFVRTGQNIRELRSTVRRLCRSFGLQFVVVDNVSRMVRPKADRDDLAVGANVSAIKDLARECNVAILAQAQMTRAAEERTRPLLSDVAYSSMIEHEADVVLLMWKTQDEPDLVRFCVAKNRGGPAFVESPLLWQGEYVRFVEEAVQLKEQQVLVEDEDPF